MKDVHFYIGLMDENNQLTDNVVTIFIRDTSNKDFLSAQVEEALIALKNAKNKETKQKYTDMS